MDRRGPSSRGAVIALVAAFTLATTPASAAVPPPPPNPSDEALQRGEDAVERAAARVGELTNKVTQASAALTKAQTKLAAAYEKVTRAQQQAQAARAVADAAKAVAESKREAASAALSQIQRMREQVDQLAAASFQQANMFASARAYLSSDDLPELLSKSSLLNALGRSKLDTLDEMRRALVTKANAESAAQSALRQARSKQQAAEQAEAEASQAYRAAVANEAAAQQRAEKLLERKKALRSQLAEARRKLTELREQQQNYGEWLAAKQAAEQAAKQQAQSEPRPPEPSTADPPDSHQPHQVSATWQPGGVVAPTSGTITSTYGPRGGSIHYGVDIANNIGTPIYSVMDGVVISSGPASGFGLWVRVRHDDGTITVYGHINATLVSVGQRVSAGERIALMGNRGQSSGPHLHFEVHKGGQAVNPLVWLRANGVSM